MLPYSECLINLDMDIGGLSRGLNYLVDMLKYGINGLWSGAIWILLAGERLYLVMMHR